MKLISPTCSPLLSQGDYRLQSRTPCARTRVETVRGLRLRLDADEGERLGLFEGNMAQVGVRGGSPAAYHILSVVAVDPCWTWIELSVAPVGVGGRR
ncbi:MAG TPA: hypothetical protein VM533_17900 [Fimbriiglobus sp.]|nr:hypothetical protein [Fimbriiglobus sp.]